MDSVAVVSALIKLLMVLVITSTGIFPDVITLDKEPYSSISSSIDIPDFFAVSFNLS